MKDQEEEEEKFLRYAEFIASFIDPERFKKYLENKEGKTAEYTNDELSKEFKDKYGVDSFEAFLKKNKKQEFTSTDFPEINITAR